MTDTSHSKKILGIKGFSLKVNIVLRINVFRTAHEEMVVLLTEASEANTILVLVINIILQPKFIIIMRS